MTNSDKQEGFEATCMFCEDEKVTDGYASINLADEVEIMCGDCYRYFEDDKWKRSFKKFVGELELKSLLRSWNSNKIWLAKLQEEWK